MPFPPPCVDTIDWNDIGFRVREVNGHIECHYSVKEKQWTDPRFVEDPYLKIHGLAPGLNYGQQAYEGLKGIYLVNLQPYCHTLISPSYNTKHYPIAFRDPSDQIRIFRPTQNASRMVHSASFISIPAVPESLFLKCVHLAVGCNAAYVPPHDTGAALYIRPLVFGSSAQLGLSPPEEYTFVVYVLPVGVYHGIHPVDALILEDFDRAAPEGTGSAKIGGNYAPVMRFSEKAKQEGYGITLHLDSKTRREIDEFSTAGFVGLKKEEGVEGYTLVVPDSKNVIESVTSESCQQLAKSFGWKVEVRPILYEELPTFEEILAAGTAAALVPIKSITFKSRDQKFLYRNGSDEPGPGCVKLLNTLKGIQQGKLEDSFGWCQTVSEPVGFEGYKDASSGSQQGWGGYLIYLRYAFCYF